MIIRPDIQDIIQLDVGLGLGAKLIARQWSVAYELVENVKINFSLEMNYRPTHRPKETIVLETNIVISIGAYN